MSESSEDKNINTKNQNKEKKYNLVQTVMCDKNLININQQQNFFGPPKNPEKINANKTNSKSNSNNTSGNINIMQEMKTKILNNDFEEIKKLLKNSSSISQATKNKLLNLSFMKYNSTNNRNQRKIILELINHGADPNNKLFFEESNDKSKSNHSSSLINTNIKINPLIFCCLKGDYELYELLKTKVNLSTSNEENNNHNNNFPNNTNKNYFFYFFENNLNMENKYKIASDILLLKKNNNNINININEYDKQTGLTLLMISVKKQYIIFVNLFLDNGADVNAKNCIDGNTALHYAAMVKNKQIIELFLKNNKCDLLIKNNNEETIVDVASKNNSTEIYALLASKYTDQQKLLEEKNGQEENFNNDFKINNGNGMNHMNMYNSYNMRNNSIEEIDGAKDGDEGLNIIKKNQVNNKIEDLSSYLEIPFQFYNHFNYINHYDSNNINNNQNNINFNNNYGQNELNNNAGNIRNYLRFKSTPILNINLKSEEDEDLLILDNLKRENDEYDNEFDKLENKLETVYNEYNKLLKELSKVNNEIKSVNNEINSYSKQIEEKNKRNMDELNNINMQKKAENSVLDILLSQENFINLKNCHDKLLKDEDYLNKKFSDEIFDENDIKNNLVKDILDFQRYIKSQVEDKEKQNAINKIRSSLQETLEINNFQYNVYIFGSYATGLNLYWSDLDLILINKKPKSNNDTRLLQLEEILEILKNQNWINKPILMKEYYFPYIIFSTDQEHGFIKVNLTIDDNKENLHKSVKLIQNFINTYKILKPLTLVIKHLMKCSNTLFSLSNYLNNSSQMINSYSIILMIIYFFQYQLLGMNTVKMINNPDNLGELFINFLVYYINYDYNEKNYIFVRIGLKDSLENDDYLHLSSLGSKLIIIDPLDHKNNVSLRTEEFRNIQIILKLIYFSSKVKCDCSCHYLKNYHKNGDNYNNFEDDQNFVDLGTEHCILKKIFQTAFRINSNLLKEFN